MPAVSLTNALKEFEASLDDFDSNLRFVSTANRLRPRLGGNLQWPGMAPDAKKLVESFLRGVAEDSVLYRGLVVSLFGAFEQFVRRILRDGVAAVGTNLSSYDSLHDGLKKANMYWTGKALQTIFEPVEYLQLEFDILSKNVGTCFAGSKQATLNADAFAIFVSILTPSSLTETLKRISVELQWDEFGKVSELQKALGEKGTRETTKAVENFLKRFAQMRNKIAHTGSSGIVVNQSDVEQLLIFFRAFGRALARAVEKDLTKHLAK